MVQTTPASNSVSRLVLKKYLVFGGGYLGDYLGSYFGNQCTVRIKSQEDADAALAHYEPDYVINCIGKTGTPNVDWCESHKPETFFANVVVPTFLAESCRRSCAKMVHIGSGCVYQGDKGFTETDEPNFTGSYYSWTKAVSEKYLAGLDALQVRIRMPINGTPHPRNLLTKLLSYSEIVNSPNSITYLPDLAVSIDLLLNKDASGIFNIVNPGSITHDRLLKIYEEEANEKLSYKLLTTQELDAITVAPRSNCVLSPRKALDFGLDLLPVEEAVRRCARLHIESSKGGSR